MPTKRKREKAMPAWYSGPPIYENLIPTSLQTGVSTLWSMVHERGVDLNTFRERDWEQTLIEIERAWLETEDVELRRLLFALYVLMDGKDWLKPDFQA